LPVPLPFLEHIHKFKIGLEKVCECFNADFFQAIKIIYGYALREPFCLATSKAEKAMQGGFQAVGKEPQALKSAFLIIFMQAR
jgi:hypothetical protein